MLRRFVPFLLITVLIFGGVSLASCNRGSEGLSISIERNIIQLVEELEYSNETANALIQVVNDWTDQRGRPALTVLGEKLKESTQAYNQGKISKEELAEIEAYISRELARSIETEISYKEGYFDLTIITEEKRANCLGYTQLFFTLGKAIGLSVTPIEVKESSFGELERNHIACLVNLSNDQKMMVDLASFPVFWASEPFILEEEFEKEGNYWEIRNETNPLNLYKRIRVEDRDGLIADLWHCRGCVYDDSGCFTKAIECFDKAIERDPKLVSPYVRRGNIYYKLRNYSSALSDYSEAIRLDPERPVAYLNRGTVYYNQEDYSSALSDYSEAIRLDPEYVEAYNNRGSAYFILRNYTSAISDFSEAIRLDPKHAQAYFNRGLAYALLKDYSRAREDLNKAKDLDPNLETKVEEALEIIEELEEVEAEKTAAILTP